MEGGGWGGRREKQMVVFSTTTVKHITNSNFSEFAKEQ